MVHEYRRYEVAPGRQARLDQRFEELTLPLWERHGIRPLGIWQAGVGNSNELHYLLEWDSLGERERRFGAMLADPEWVSGRAQSEADGPLLTRAHNEIWVPTAYSPQH